AERDGYYGASARQHPGSSKRTRGASRVERAPAPTGSATHLRSFARSALAAVTSPVARRAPAALRNGAACRFRPQPFKPSTHQRPLPTSDFGLQLLLSHLHPNPPSSILHPSSSILDPQSSILALSQPLTTK